MTVMIKCRSCSFTTFQEMYHIKLILVFSKLLHCQRYHTKNLIVHICVPNFIHHPMLKLCHKVIKEVDVSYA